MGSTAALTLPFTDRWVVRNSPARRVPSHGTDLLGTRYAIDFVGVDERRRTADQRDWRTLLATEPPQRFVAYGRPILAPADGVVVAVHDGERDHEARRSQLGRCPYALGQASRLRHGAAAMAGNLMVIALRDGGAFVAMAHLRAGSIRVGVGDEVVLGRQIAECGNSGNSTQHLAVARGLPIAFRSFREWPRGRGTHQDRDVGLPGEGAVVEPV